MLRMLAGSVAVASTSIFLMADTGEVIPVGLEKNLTGKVDELIEEAQWGKWGRTDGEAFSEARKVGADRHGESSFLRWKF